jgi:hypothetical protein
VALDGDRGDRRVRQLDHVQAVGCGHPGEGLCADAGRFEAP